MDLSGAPKQFPRRSTDVRPRDSVFLLADLRGPDGAVQRCRVRNISPEGICLEQPVGLARGDRVSLSIGSIPHAEADIVWAGGNFAGLHFTRPIDTALARKRPARSLDPRAGWSGPGRG